MAKILTVPVRRCQQIPMAIMEMASQGLMADRRDLMETTSQLKAAAMAAAK